MKQMKIGVLAFLACTMMCCTSQHDDNSFTINGTVIGDTIPQKIVLSYGNDNEISYDTAQVENGKFTFKGNISSPTIANISLSDKMLWIEPSTMELKLDINKKTLDLKGSKTFDDQEHYYHYVDSIIKSYNPVYMKLYRLDSLIKQSNGNDLPTLKKEFELLKDSLERNKISSLDIQRKFISNYPDSYMSSFLLYPINAGEVLPVDTCNKIFSTLDADVQKASFGAKIKHDLLLREKNVIGRIAPDFLAYDTIHHENVTLSHYQGKVVLMDFWAPWCSPCRWGFKHLKELYKEYHDKGLEIIAVYSDKKEQTNAWMNAIKHDGVEEWHHVRIAEKMSDPEGLPTDIRNNYYVQAIPRKVLIGRDGKIINIWVGVSDKIETEVDNAIKSALK